MITTPTSAVTRAHLSPFAHLMGSILLSRRNKRITVTALAGYSDASGLEGEGDSLVVAGLLGKLDDWTIFDERWLERMRGEGLPSFRMAELTHSRGVFAEGWEGDEPRRIALLNTLIELTNETAQKAFVRSVDLVAYRAINLEYELTEQFGGPYAIAQAQCLIAAFEWFTGEQREAPNSVGFLIEESDMGQDAFWRLLRTDLPLWAPYVQIVPKRPEGEELTPFHACDLIAYEYRRELNQRLAPIRDRPARGALLEINATLHPKATVIDRDALLRMCAKGNIPKRVIPAG